MRSGDSPPSSTAGLPEWLCGRAQFLRFAPQADQRGMLLPIELEDIPFVVRRIFVISPGDAGEIRGGHSHRNGRQLLVCLDGEIEVSLQEAGCTHAVTLRPDGVSLIIEAGLWSQQTYASASSRLLVLSDQNFGDVEYVSEPLIGAPSGTRK